MMGKLPPLPIDAPISFVHSQPGAEIDVPTFESSVASFSVLMIVFCASNVVGLSLKFPPTKN